VSEASPSSSQAAPASTSSAVSAAKGAPYVVGNIVEVQTSFATYPPSYSDTPIAFEKWVNARGGINGHPIKYYIENEQTNPGQISAEAKQLVQTDHVVGIVGNTSIIECSIDHSYWQKLGFFVVDDDSASSGSWGPFDSSQMSARAWTLQLNES